MRFYSIKFKFQRRIWKERTRLNCILFWGCQLMWPMFGELCRLCVGADSVSEIINEYRIIDLGKREGYTRGTSEWMALNWMRRVHITQYWSVTIDTHWFYLLSRCTKVNFADTLFIDRLWIYLDHCIGCMHGYTYIPITPDAHTMKLEFNYVWDEINENNDEEPLIERVPSIFKRRMHASRIWLNSDCWPPNRPYYSGRTQFDSEW